MARRSHRLDHCAPPVDPPDDEWGEPDPDCHFCHGRGYVTDPGEAGIVHGKWRVCGHCIGDDYAGPRDSRDVEADRGDELYHRMADEGKA